MNQGFTAQTELSKWRGGDLFTHMELTQRCPCCIRTDSGRACCLLMLCGELKGPVWPSAGTLPQDRILLQKPGLKLKLTAPPRSWKTGRQAGFQLGLESSAGDKVSAWGHGKDWPSTSFPDLRAVSFCAFAMLVLSCSSSFLLPAPLLWLCFILTHSSPSLSFVQNLTAFLDVCERSSN